MQSALPRLTVVIAGTALSAAPAAAQGAETRTGLDPALQGGVGFVVTLLVGLMLVSNLEGFTARVSETLRRQPAVSFMTGLAVLVGFVVVLGLCLLLGVVGAVLLLFVGLAIGGLSVAGNAIAYITVFSPYVGRFPALVLAALVAGVFGYLPAIGGDVELAGRALSFLLGTAGLGGMAIVYRE